MQRTNKYKLNIIETSDAFSPEPLNKNTEELEKALTALEAADAKLQTTLETADARLQTAVQKAQSTADFAYKPGQMPYVTGTYVSTGADVTINLGFRPSFVIISGSSSTGQNTSLGPFNAFTAGNIITGHVTFTNTGFIARATGNTFPDVSRSGRQYDYIAFR